MPETIAPAPLGVQAPTTYIPPQGTVKEPLKVKAGDIYKKEFDKLTKEVEPKKEEPRTEPLEAVKQEPKPEVKVEEKPVETKPEPKPESPLDVLTAKKEEPKPEEPDVLKEFDEKTANWQRAREVMKTQGQEVRDLKSKVEELSKTPKTDPNALTALTQERDQLKERVSQQEKYLKAINAEYSEDYQKLVTKRDESVNKIANRVKAYGGDPDTLVAALSLPDSKFKTQQIKESLGEMEPDEKARVHALIETYEERNDAINDYRKDLPQKWDEIQARRDAQLQEQQAAGIKQLESEFSKIAEGLPVSTITLRRVPDDVPQAADWNKEVDDAFANALRVMKPNGADLKETTTIAVKGARYDSLEKRYLQLHADYVALKKSNGQTEAAAPDFKGGTKPTSGPKKTPTQKYHETYEQLTGSAASVAP